MPRPALKEERREQILQAFERCVARYGIEGATLERIAEEASLARALIRHNVGNRDDLVLALIERFFAHSDNQWAALTEALPEKNKTKALIEYLFDSRYSDSQQVLITEALIAGGAQDKQLAKRLRDWIDQSLDVIADIIRQDFQEAASDRVEACAAGILGIYFNVDSFALIGDMSRLRGASRAAALTLVDNLEKGVNR
ncbi:TetR/AcrR family transcriptional regulator [Sphingorhabdus sp. EL138]|jgi:AcrR family transcriptional regulator|uniref:TetR/AcrR family transcriptional regulator n=1 Tax=Sphingorhabdus sp. EL138 TaxID=2073156 RepID=UPI000D692E0C|nr:TetR/AcrR family transcriptional regulator [Sphingorhabdus sp. EL138]